MIMSKEHKAELLVKEAALMGELKPAKYAKYHSSTMAYHFEEERIKATFRDVELFWRAWYLGYDVVPEELPPLRLF